MFTSDLGFCIADIILLYWKSEKMLTKILENVVISMISDL